MSSLDEQELDLQLGEEKEKVRCLREELKRVKREVGVFRAFANELLTQWPEEAGIDGASLQDLCVKHSLLIATFPKEPCLPNCWCAGYYGSGIWQGVVCYRKTELLTGAPKDPPNKMRVSGVPYPVDKSGGGKPD